MQFFAPLPPFQTIIYRQNLKHVSNRIVVYLPCELNMPREEYEYGGNSDHRIFFKPEKPYDFHERDHRYKRPENRENFRRGIQIISVLGKPDVISVGNLWHFA